jgi:hypothetical protein
MKKPTHFLTMHSDGSSHVQPLVRNRPKVDLLAPKPKHPAACCCETCHPRGCGCAGCVRMRADTEARVKAANIEANELAALRARMRHMPISTFLIGPAGSSVLDR